MGRKLTKNEKGLILLLIIAIIGLCYYYLFWDKITKKISQVNMDISSIQVTYDDYQRKVNGLDELRRKLESIKGQPSYKDKFYKADENQEVYMDFLQKLVTDNNLALESVVFAKNRIELPDVGFNNQNGNSSSAPVNLASPNAGSNAEPKTHFNVTTATVSFSVDYDKPERILNALEAIEKNEKMVIVDNMQINIAMQSKPTDNSNSGAARPVNNTTEKIYKCIAVVKFVNFADPSNETLDLASAAQPNPAAVEVPVTTAQP